MLFKNNKVNHQKILKKLEKDMMIVELRLAGYLDARKKYRLTDFNDKKAEMFRKFHRKVKTKQDLQRFVEYHYYLGKHIAYSYILFWLIENWHKKENKALEDKL